MSSAMMAGNGALILEIMFIVIIPAIQEAKTIMGFSFLGTSDI